MFAERYRQEVLAKREITKRAKELMIGKCGTLAKAKHRGLRAMAKK